MMSSSQAEEGLKYIFKFDKVGLEPNEYESCLTSKMDSLVDGHPDEIKKLTKVSIMNVQKEIRVCQIDSKKDTRMDRRLKASPKYIDEGYLKDDKDTFWKHNNRSGGTQGNEEETDVEKWAKKYNSNQEMLFKTDLLKSRFRPVDTDDSTQLCNAIDEVTAALIRDLSESKQLDETEVKEVYELCGRIVRGRTAVHWAIVDNLLGQGIDEWKNRVFVIMSLSALMVVADMLLRTGSKKQPTDGSKKDFEAFVRQSLERLLKGQEEIAEDVSKLKAFNSMTNADVKEEVTESPQQ